MLVVGDLHGNWGYLKQLIDNTRETSIIQVGDFGLGFNSLKWDIGAMDNLNERLSRKDKHLYVIRGNHDDPVFWKEESEFNVQWSNITLVGDWTVLCIEGSYVLFAGGAVSIDRKIRKEGRDHWHDSIFDYDEDKLNAALEKWDTIDLVITHTAPSFASPKEFGSLVYNYASIDPELIADLLLERQLLDRMHSVIVHKTKPKTWVYGHFHSDVTEEINGIKFILLGIGSTTNI